MQRPEELHSDKAFILEMRGPFILLIVLILHAGALAQSPAEKFVAWSARNPSMRPSIFFNQPRYSPGDTAWFKAYIFENDSLLNRSVILSVALYNKNAQQVALANVRVQGGQAHCQIVLPDTLSPGYYRAGAFNEYMVNNPSSSVFQQELEVVRKQVIRSSPIAMSFVAEGGRLVRGVTNKIIVQTTDESAGGMCELVDESGSVITTFKVRSGIGFFHLKPDMQKTYSVRSNGRNYALPAAKDDGITILLTPGAGTASTRVILSAPAGSAHREENLQAVLTINGNVHYQAPLNLGDREFIQFAFPQASLPTGIATLSIFSWKLDLLAERSFYVSDNEEINALLKPRKETVAQHGLVQVEVNLTDNAGKPVQGEFAVTALNQKLFPSDEGGSVTFPGGHPLAEGWSGTDRREMLDLQLAATSPKADLWKAVFDTAKTERPAGALLHFKGRAFDKTTLAAVPDYTRIALYLQRGMAPYECMVFDGVFDLHLIADFNGVDEFFYEAEYKGKPLKNVEIRWEHQTPTFAPASPSIQEKEIDAYGDFLVKSKVINQSFSFYEAGHKPQSASVDPNEGLEYEAGGADVVVTIDKFIAFPNMDEVIREIIPSLSHRKERGSSAVRVLLYGTDYDSKADPLYVIDGLMTRDTEYFLSLKPSNLITIKVVREFRKLSPMGPLGANGIVFVHSKIPDHARVRAGSQFISAQGVSKPLAFQPANHAEETDTRVPDFRPTLYWNPSIKTDKAGKAMISFYASDDTGPILLKLIGLTAQGQPFSATTRVNVAFVQDGERK